MKNLNKKTKIIYLILFVIIGGFFVVLPAMALETGLQYGTITGLGTQDLRVAVMSVIRAILGFLGIVALVIIIYGGFVWFTAAGNEERITLAKKILINAIIGLVIILTSFAITTFVINQLILATGAGYPMCTPDACVGCHLKCNSSGSGIDYVPGECGGLGECFPPPPVDCPKPSLPAPYICRITSTGVAMGGIPQGARGDFATVEGWYFGAYGPGSAVSFAAQAAEVVNCNGTPLWFERGDNYSYARVIVPPLTPMQYQVTVTNSVLKQTSGGSPFIITMATAGPGLACIVPPSGKNKEQLTQAEGVRFGLNPAPNGGLIFTAHQTSTYTTWTDILISQPVVPDVAVTGDAIVKNTLGKKSNPVYFIVTCAANADCASQCCKNNSCQPAANCLPGPGESCDANPDPGCQAGSCQPGIICDSNNCLCRLPGPGENCDLTGADIDSVCVPGACAGDALCFADNVNCTCQEVPIIDAIAPVDESGTPNGAAGNFITIYGRHFGTAKGTVVFLGAEGDADNKNGTDPSTINPACLDTWQDNQIIIAVPPGAADGPIKVIKAGGVLADATDDNVGPKINPFDVNSTIRPGICSVINTLTYEASGRLNDPVRVQGNHFSGASQVYFAQVIAAGSPLVTGNITITNIKVPNVEPATVGVRVKEGNEYSNPYNFSVSPAVTAPIIYGFSPPGGAAGTYVTITGAHFGDKKDPGGHAYFIDSVDGGQVEADYSFPPECSQSVWKDSQIIVKAPAALASGANYLLKVRTSSGEADTGALAVPYFNFNPVLTRPNICALVPDNGPIHTEIDIYGQNYVANSAAIVGITFYQFPSIQNIFDYSTITHEPPLGNTDLIQTLVPGGSMTGPVKVLNAISGMPPQESNGLNFRVGDCVAEPGGCLAGECCAAGIYKGSCMPTGDCAGLATQAAYLWDFTTGVKPGYCSQDVGICVADNTLCAPGYTCNADTCDCEPLPAYQCSKQVYPACDPGDNLCTSAQYCDNACQCQALVPCDGNTATPACDPDQNICHSQIGLDFYCAEDCFCHRGIKCDGDTTTPLTCEPNDDICKQVSTTLKCNEDTCLCEPFAQANQAAYLWQFNSFSPGPQVIEECNRKPDCAKVCAQDRERSCAEDVDCQVGGTDYGPCIKAFSSPSPWNWRDGEVHVDSIISASFTEKVRNETVVDPADSSNHPNIKLMKCAAGATFIPGSCNTEITGRIEMFDFPYGLVDSEGFDLYPSALLTADTWYQVIITRGVIGEDGLPLAHIPDYRFEFKTLSGSEFGHLGCISCQPGLATLRSRYDGGCAAGDLDCQKYMGHAWDKDIVCVLLDPKTHSWDWELTNKDADEGTLKRASILNEITNQPAVPADDSPPSKVITLIKNTDNIIWSYARQETTPEKPVLVQATVPLVDPVMYQYGDNICNLQIDFSTPVVTKRWPDCGTACTNALVGAAFSVTMDQATLTLNQGADSGLVLYACSNNADCRPGYGTCSLSGAYCVLSGSGTDCPYYDDLGETCDDTLYYDQTPVPLPGWQNVEDVVNGWPHAYLAAPHCFDYNGDGKTDYCLLPNTNYRVILHKSITSDQGKHLGALNYRDVLDSVSSAGFDSYSWTFKTQAEMCLPGRVEVNPAENWMPVDEIDRYSSNAYAAGDMCDPEGQPLIAASFTWDWQSTSCWVADLLANKADGYLNNHDFTKIPPECTPLSDYAILRSGCGNGWIGPGEDCDDGNIANNDGCSSVCLNEGAGVLSAGVGGGGGGGGGGGAKVTIGGSYSYDFNGAANTSPNFTDTPFGGTSFADLKNYILYTNFSRSGWSIDETGGVNGSGAVKASGTGNTYESSAAMKEGFSEEAGHYFVSAKLRIDNISANYWDAGLIFGWDGTGNQWTFRWRHLGNTPPEPGSQKFIFVGSSHNILGASAVMPLDKQWHEIKVEVINHNGTATLNGYFDGNPILTAEVQAEVRGDAGLFVHSPVDGAWFDDLAVAPANAQAGGGAGQILPAQAGTCGNGVIDVGEDCDDGNTADGDGCSHLCLWEGTGWYASGNGFATASVCGNGVVEAGEGCDNGSEPNGNNSDGCTDICTLAGSENVTWCGNSVKDPGEQCDQGGLVKYTCPHALEVCDPNDALACGGVIALCTAKPKTGNNCTGIYISAQDPEDPPPAACSSFTSKDICEKISTDPAQNHQKWCYWTAAQACRVRPCLRLDDTNLGNNNYHAPGCGNGLVENGEECDYGSFCENSWGGVSACNSLNAATACKDGVCGSNACLAKVGNAVVVCNDGTAADVCKTGACGLKPNATYPDCSDHCLHTGSVSDGRSRQIVKALYDGITDIQAWTEEFTPSAGGPLGFGHLVVGTGGYDGPVVIDRWPYCESACLNAAMGCQFSMSMDAVSSSDPGSITNPNNIFLYECRDSACDVSQALNISPILISKFDQANADDSINIELPPTYNNRDIDGDGHIDGGLLLPDTWYRVVIHNSVVSAGTPKNLGNLNFDDPFFGGTTGRDSYSWKFKTEDTSTLCTIGRVTVNPPKITLPPLVYQTYFSQPWSDPDACDPRYGQRLNPWFYNWDWNRLDLDPPYTAANLEMPLRDGCGNTNIEWGESCDDGNVSNADTCSFPGCQNKGTSACDPGNGITANCCGNNLIENGEDCEPGVNGTICRESGVIGGTCAYPANYCDTNCTWTGNHNYSLASGSYVPIAVCGNGILEPGEECDLGTEPDGNDADGCRDNCSFSGAIPGTTAICGDKKVEFGEECDNGELTSFHCKVTNTPCDPAAPGVCNGFPQNCVNTPKSNDGCTGIDDWTAHPCGNIGNATDCQNNRWCYWTGNACLTRPCLNEAETPVAGNTDWHLPVCGNGNLEIGEECDWGSDLANYSSYGCGDTCLNTGSIKADGKTDPYQIVHTEEITTTLEIVREEIQAWHRLQPEIVGLGELDVYYGLKVPFAVIGHQPPPDTGTDVECRNVAVWAVFSRELEQATIKTGNLFLRACDFGTPNAYVPCTSATNYLKSFSYQPVAGKCVNDACDFGDMADAANRPFGSCHLDADCAGSVVKVTGLFGHCADDNDPCEKDADCEAGSICEDFGFLAPDTSYQIYVNSNINTGIKQVSRCYNTNAVCTADADCGAGNTCKIAEGLNCNTENQKCAWSFSTDSSFCECNYVGAKIQYTSAGAFTTRDFFTCAGNECGSNTKIRFDDDFIPAQRCASGDGYACNDETQEDICGDAIDCINVPEAMAGNQHNYLAECYNINPQKSTPLSNSNIRYDWAEIDPDNLIFLNRDPFTHNCLDGWEFCYVTPGEDIAGSADPGQPKGKNGTAEVLITAQEYKWSDSGGFCVPGTSDRCTISHQECASDADCNAGETCAVKCASQAAAAAPRDITVTNFICDNPWPQAGPFADSENNCQPTIEHCLNTNFKLYYCRDYGNPGFADDLPALVEDPVIHGYKTATTTLKDFLFPFAGFVTNKVEELQSGDYNANHNYGRWTYDSNTQNNSPFGPNYDSRHFGDSIAINQSGSYSLAIYTYNQSANGHDLSGRVGDSTYPYPGHQIEVWIRPADKADAADWVKKGTIANPATGPDKIQRGTVALGELPKGQYDVEFRWINDWCACEGCGWGHLTAACDANLYFKEWSIGSTAYSADGLGLQIYANPLHLSPATWYKSGLCGGQPDIKNICYGNADCAVKNLALDGGFEQGTLLWEKAVQAGGAADFTAPNASARSGSLGASLAYTPPAVPDPDIHWGAHIYQDITLPAGIYSFSGYAKSDKLSFINVRIPAGAHYPALCNNPNCDLEASGKGGVCNTQALDASGLPRWEPLACNFTLTQKTLVRLTAGIRLEGSVSFDDLKLASPCVLNVPQPGSGQEILVDGYRAVRDGRTVYVGAANKTSFATLDSNIYLISYNLGAKPQTQEIFNRLLDPAQQKGVWSFNANQTNHRLCQAVGVYAGTDQVCDNVGVVLECDFGTPADCAANALSGCYWSNTLNLCQGRLCLPLYCKSDFDCPDLSCSADKEMLVRDNARYGDLRDLQLTLEKYRAQKGEYPKLEGGTYIASTTFSLWPSWQQTLGAALGASLFADPLNKFRGCGYYYCDLNNNNSKDADEGLCEFGIFSSCGQRPQACKPLDADLQNSCWDEQSRLFSCPANMFAYAYRSTSGGKSYELYTNFEYTGSGSWRIRDGSVPSPFFNLPTASVSGGTCERLNFEINQAKFAVGPGLITAALCQDGQKKYCFGPKITVPNLHGDCDSDSFCQTQFGDPNAHCLADADSDGVCDSGFTDNCSPVTMCPTNPRACYNPGQRDTDGDGIGDVCDPNCTADSDKDGVCDEYDNCRTVANCTLAEAGGAGCVAGRGGDDSDGDGIGDACDPCTDIDQDGFWDVPTGANDERVCPRDNCAPIDSTNDTNCDYNLDVYVAFVSDISGSMRYCLDGSYDFPAMECDNPDQRRIDYLIPALQDSVSSLFDSIHTHQIRLNVALIRFNSAVLVDTGPVIDPYLPNALNCTNSFCQSDRRADLITTIGSYSDWVGGGTFTSDALESAHTLLNGMPPGVKIIIIMSDGDPNEDYDPADEAGLIKGDGISIYSIALTSDESLKDDMDGWSSNQASCAFCEGTEACPFCYGGTNLQQLYERGIIQVIKDIPDNACSNPLQEDFDNDGIGYLCDQCVDIDRDGFGDWPLITHSSSTEDALISPLLQAEAWHFAGCRGTESPPVFKGFQFYADKAVPDPNVDLDICPAGPFGVKCKDKFGISVSCNNPAATWTDINGTEYTNTQPDFNLNNVGDICDFEGNARLDPGEECDCGDIVLSQDTNNPFECTTLNDHACLHSGRCNDCCSYCQRDAAGVLQIAQACGPYYGDGIVNCGEECDCGDSPENMSAANSHQDQNGFACQAQNNINCLTTHPGGKLGYDEQCSWCNHSYAVTEYGPHFGDGIVDATNELCDCGEERMSADPANLANSHASGPPEKPNKPLCSTINDVPCAPDKPCDAFCDYCARDDAGTPGRVVQEGRECVPCRADDPNTPQNDRVCDLNCINAINDGCCRRDKGEDITNEYGCPVRVGETIKIKTVANSDGCGKKCERRHCEQPCHPSVWLGVQTRPAVPDGVFANNQAVDFVVRPAAMGEAKGSKCRPELKKPAYHCSNMPAQACSGSADTSCGPSPAECAGDDVYDHDCVSLERTAGGLTGRDWTRWVAVNPEKGPWVWEVHVLNQDKLYFSSIFSLQDGNNVGTNYYWKTDWNDGGFRKHGIGTSEDDSSWEKYQVCNDEGRCAKGEFTDECNSDAECRVAEDDACVVTTCYQPASQYSACIIESNITTCSGWSSNGCCPAGCVLDTTSPNYDIDCDTVTAGAQIVLQTYGSYNVNCGLENHNVYPTWLDGGDNSDEQVRAIIGASHLQPWTVLPAWAGSCGGSGDPVPMPGKGDGYPDGNRNYFKDGDCLSLAVNEDGGGLVGFRGWSDNWLMRDDPHDDKIPGSYKLHVKNGTNLKLGSQISLQKSATEPGQTTPGEWWSTEWCRPGHKDNPPVGTGKVDDQWEQYLVCDINGKCAPTCFSNEECGECQICNHPSTWAAYCGYKGCFNNDGCCTAGCTNANDNDCPPDCELNNNGCCQAGTETIENEYGCSLKSGDIITLWNDYWVSVNQDYEGLNLNRPDPTNPGWTIGDWERFRVLECHDETGAGNRQELNDQNCVKLLSLKTNKMVYANSGLQKYMHAKDSTGSRFEEILGMNCGECAGSPVHIGDILSFNGYVSAKWDHPEQALRWHQFGNQQKEITHLKLGNQDGFFGCTALQVYCDGGCVTKESPPLSCVKDADCDDGTSCTLDKCASPCLPCFNTKIMSCSGNTHDGCCPSGCTHDSACEKNHAILCGKNADCGDSGPCNFTLNTTDKDCSAVPCSKPVDWACTDPQLCSPTLCQNVNVFCSCTGEETKTLSVFCLNNSNDGCCAGDETIGDEYSCQLQDGDTISLYHNDLSHPAGYMYIGGSDKFVVGGTSAAGDPYFYVIHNESDPGGVITHGSIVSLVSSQNSNYLGLIEADPWYVAASASSAGSWEKFYLYKSDPVAVSEVSLGDQFFLQSTAYFTNKRQLCDCCAPGPFYACWSDNDENACDCSPYPYVNWDPSPAEAQLTENEFWAGVFTACNWKGHCSFSAP